jgi:ferredoxin
MSKRWYPVINYETCIECGACIQKCSHGVYDKEEVKPNVIYPYIQRDVLTAAEVVKTYVLQSL